MVRIGYKAVGLTSTILPDVGKIEGQELTGKSPTAMVVSVVVVLLVLIIVGVIAGVILSRRCQKCREDPSSKGNESQPMTNLSPQPQTPKGAERVEPVDATG